MKPFLGVYKMNLPQIEAQVKNVNVVKRKDGRFELRHLNSSMPLLYESFGSEQAARLKYKLVLMQSID